MFVNVFLNRGKSSAIIVPMPNTRTTLGLLRAAALTLVCVAAAVSAALPDVVHLKNGGKVEGKVTERETDILLVTASGGNITIPKSDIVRIEYKDLPAKPPEKRSEKREAKSEKKPGEADSTPAAVRLGEPVHDPLLGFRCRFPFGWRRLPQQSQTTLMTFIGLREPGYPPKIDLLHVESSEEPEAFAAELAQSYGSVTTDYKSGGATKLPNGTFRISGTFTLKNDTVAHTDIVFHRDGGDGQFFILALKCNEKSLSTHLPLLEEAAETFELIKPAEFSKADRARFQELFERGMKAAREGEQTQKAIEDLRAAAEMLPGLPDIHSTLAHLYALDGKLDLATKELRALVELLPDSADCRYNLGTHYYKLNRYEDAVENLKKAIELNPNYVEAHLNLGVILKLKGQVDEAIRAIRRALEIEPSSVTAYFNLGQIYLQKNSRNEARQAFEKVLELEPNHAGAKSALEEMKKTEK